MTYYLNTKTFNTTGTGQFPITAEYCDTYQPDKITESLSLIAIRIDDKKLRDLNS